MEDDRRALISVERNIANIERSLSASGNGGGDNGATLASAADGAVVRNHHSHAEAARGLGKLFPGGRSSSLGRTGLPYPDHVHEIRTYVPNERIGFRAYTLDHQPSQAMMMILIPIGVIKSAGFKSMFHSYDSYDVTDLRWREVPYPLAVRTPKYPHNQNAPETAHKPTTY